MPTHASIVNSLVKRIAAAGQLDDPAIELLNEFKQKARWITRLKGPFININAIFLAGISAQSAELSHAADEDSEDIALFNDIMGLHPNLHEFITALASKEDLDAYHTFCRTITEIMSDARASDTSRLVSHIINYMPHDIVTSVALPMILNDKSKRGWNHNTTAAALCPLKLRTKFLFDPVVFRNSVQSGTLRIKTGHYPCFLYPDNAAYNSKNIAKGLFRGHIFIRALRSIYTELHGMKEVTPEMIAYISVQTHFALSDMRNWADISHSSFNYEKFFNNIVKLFHNRDSTWVRETLEYVTSQLPALNRRRRNQKHTTNLDSDQDSEDDTEAILAQQQDSDTGEAQENGNDGFRDSEHGRRDAHEGSPLPHSSPTTAQHRAAPEPQPVNNGSEAQEANTSSRQPRPGATPTQETAAANGRRPRPVDSDEDDQQGRKGPSIIVPPFQAAQGKRRKRRY